MLLILTGLVFTHDPISCTAFNTIVLKYGCLSVCLMCLPFLRMAIVDCLSIAEYSCDLLNNKKLQ